MGRVVRLASEGIFVTTEEAKRISITSHNCKVLPPLNLNIYNKYAQPEYLWNNWLDIFGTRMRVKLVCA